MSNITLQTGLVPVRTDWAKAAAQGLLKAYEAWRQRIFEDEVFEAMKPRKFWFWKRPGRTRKEAEDYVLDRADGTEAWQISGMRHTWEAEEVLESARVSSDDFIYLTTEMAAKLAPYSKPFA